MLSKTAREKLLSFVKNTYNPAPLESQPTTSQNKQQAPIMNLPVPRRGGAIPVPGNRTAAYGNNEITADINSLNANRYRDGKAGIADYSFKGNLPHPTTAKPSIQNNTINQAAHDVVESLGRTGRKINMATDLAGGNMGGALLSYAKAKVPVVNFGDKVVQTGKRLFDKDYTGAALEAAGAVVPVVPDTINALRDVTSDANRRAEEGRKMNLRNREVRGSFECRNTGIADHNGQDYVNTEDLELLGKLGFDFSESEYKRLEKTSEVLDVYSYIEKVAGVPKEVTKLIDSGKAFSGEYLKDMGYKLPKGYEVKGDLCCPVDSKESSRETSIAEKQSSEKPGLWANIRAKRARGEKAAKPGDSNYPDKEQWSKLSKAAVAAWQRSEGKNPAGGLNAKGRASYKKETGGTLKAPVTESNPSGERAKRQNSFCSRMCGMKSKRTGAKGQSDPDSRINKSLRKWNCKCGEDHSSMFEKLACVVKEAKGRCWEGYKPVPGKEAYSEDSCEPKTKQKEIHKKAVEAVATPGMWTTPTGSWHRSGDSLVNPKGRVMTNTPHGEPMVESPYADITQNVVLNVAGDLASRAQKLIPPAASNALKNVAKVAPIPPAARAFGWAAARQAVPAFSAAVGAADVHNRLQREDYPGAAISGVGVGGDIAQLVGNPTTKGIGLGASWGSTGANAARDIYRYNNRPVEFRNTPPSLPQSSTPQISPVQIPSQALAKQSAADHPVVSSNIKAVGHDKKDKVLDVLFNSGGEYMYKDVPRSLYARLLKVKSPGKFFHKHVKKDKPFEYEKVNKEAEYKWHKSKDLHRDVTNGRHYPFSFLTGEAKELVDAIKNRDMANFKEEVGDITYAAQMLAAQATGLNHPVYADLSKFHKREKAWKDMFKEKGSVYHPKHMEGGSNFAKASKIIKAFASAGIKINQREAERLANKYTGGKMEKESAYKLPRKKISVNNQELLPGMSEQLSKQPFNHAENAFAQERISKSLRDSIVSGRRAEELRPSFEKLKDFIKNL